MGGDRITSIPLDVFFGVIAALGGLVYADMKRELRALTRESRSRGLALERVRFMLRTVCDKLGIRYQSGSDSETEDSEK